MIGFFFFFVLSCLVLTCLVFSFLLLSLLLFLLFLSAKLVRFAIMSNCLIDSLYILGLTWFLTLN
jgi:hypothetical protein